MNIYSPTEEDSWWVNDLRNFIKNDKSFDVHQQHEKLPPPVYAPVLFGKDNGFYGRKHTPEQIKLWSDMRLGEKNPNYGGKAWTEESLIKLRQPKKSKKNYKGSPGKITCINKMGIPIQITTEMYHKQGEFGEAMENWEYVNTRSKEAKKRKMDRAAT
jgi:hypothetical protein